MEMDIHVRPPTENAKSRFNGDMIRCSNPKCGWKHKSEFLRTPSGIYTDKCRGCMAKYQAKRKRTKKVFSYRKAAFGGEKSW